jgi:hypothetical protein
METNYKPVPSPAHPLNANVHPVETNLLKLIALQNGLKLSHWNDILKVKEILLNSLKLN